MAEKVGKGCLVAVLVVVGLGILVAIVGTSDEAPPVPPSASPDRISTPSATPATTTTTRRATTTTTTVPARVREYVSELQSIETDARELVAHLEKVNTDWNERIVGLSATDGLLVSAVVTASTMMARFDALESVKGTAGREHAVIAATIADINLCVQAMLDGLRSPDAGQAREDALVECQQRYGQLKRHVNRVAVLVGYRPVTTTTRALSPTTTGARVTTTRRITTTTFDEQTIAELGFALFVAPHLQATGLTLEEGVLLAMILCDELDSGATFEEIKISVATAYVQENWTSAMLDAAGAIMGAGVEAYCPRHSSKIR